MELKFHVGNVTAFLKIPYYYGSRYGYGYGDCYGCDYNDYGYGAYNYGYGDGRGDGCDGGYYKIKGRQLVGDNND